MHRQQRVWISGHLLARVSFLREYRPIIGYGLARFEFPFKKVVLAVIIFTFILPSQVTMIPTYALYSQIGILGTILPFVVPPLLGMGINAPIFILIFWQFFRQVPKVLIEAAQIDGAGYFKSFFRISLLLCMVLERVISDRDVCIRSNDKVRLDFTGYSAG